MNTLNLKKRVLHWLLACAGALGFSGAWAQGPTPFGFELGRGVLQQLPTCAEVDQSRQCVNLQDAEGEVKTYQLRNEKNILGGLPQQVYLVERHTEIEQVQVVFPTQTWQQVQGLLHTVFGSPSMVGDLTVGNRQGNIAGTQEHWLLEDGVVTLLSATPSHGHAVALIRTTADFERDMQAVSLVKEVVHTEL